MEGQPEGRDTRSGGLTQLYEALALYLRRCSDAYSIPVAAGVLYGDHEEVCGPRDGVGAGAIWLAGAPTFEATEACRWP